MKILMVTSVPLAGQHDGTAMLALQVFRSLRRRGLEVGHAFLQARPPWGPMTRGELEGAPAWRLPPGRWASGLKAIHRAFPFDLVHAEHYGGATRALAGCRSGGWPLIYSVHSLLGDEVERDRLGRGLKFRPYQMLERKVCRHAAVVVVLGEQVGEVMVSEKGVPAERIRVIHPGVDLALYRPYRPAAEIEGVEPGDKVVMYVGNLEHPNQGVPLLVEALPRVFAGVPEARCVLVGGPAEVGEAYRERLGAFGERLIVVGGKTPEEIVGLARRADVLVHPRLACRENYSVQTKMAVYLASGRPIVATDFGDYQNILGRSGAGLLTPVSAEGLAEGIRRVLTDQELAGRLAEAAGPAAERFTCADGNVDRYLELYDFALSAEGTRPAARRFAETGRA